MNTLVAAAPATLISAVRPNQSLGQNSASVGCKPNRHSNYSEFDSDFGSAQVQRRGSPSLKLGGFVVAQQAPRLPERLGSSYLEAFLRKQGLVLGKLPDFESAEAR